MATIVLSKVGYPYSQANRDSGDYYDSSFLAYYAWKSAEVLDENRVNVTWKHQDIYEKIFPFCKRTVI